MRKPNLARLASIGLALSLIGLAHTSTGKVCDVGFIVVKVRRLRQQHHPESIVFSYFRQNPFLQINPQSNVACHQAPTPSTTHRYLFSLNSSPQEHIAAMASRIILVEDGSRSGSSEENRPQDSVPKKLDEALKLLKSLDKSNSTEPTTKHAKFREVEEMYVNLSVTKSLTLTTRSWNKDSETYNVVTSTEPKSKPDESDAHIFLVHNRSG